MKKNLLKTMLVATALTMGMNAWADEVTATLTHTASSFCGSDANAYTSTVDAEKEHVNNERFNATWQGAAYADFSFSLPEGASITKAVLTFRVIGEGRNARACNFLYANAGEQLDYTELSGGAAKVNLAATKIEGITFPKGAEETMEKDVTAALSAIVAAGQSNIIFKWTGNPGGGDVYGKGSAEYAPSLVITTADASKVTSYTVKYTDGEKELKEAKTYAGALIGSQATASEEDLAPIKVDGKKYIYQSGNNAITLVADAAQNVITLKFTEAKKMSYSVVSNLGTTIAEGSDYEGETIAVGYPHYILDKGVLYECPKNDSNPWYAVSITLNEATNTATVDYSESVIANVIFVSEGEALPGATVNNGGNYSDIRSFGAAVGYAAEDLTVTTLQPGKYTIKADLFTPTSAMGSQTFKVGDKEFKLTSTNNGYHNELETEEFELTEATDVVLLAGGGNTNAIDWLYIRGIVTTGISQMQCDSNAQQAIFNLQGQQVQQAQKGLYIIDGKKVMVK